MMSGALELFYSYAHKDEALRKKLDIHLAMLRHEGLVKYPIAEAKGFKRVRGYLTIRLRTCKGARLFQPSRTMTVERSCFYPRDRCIAELTNTIQL